MIFFSTTFSPGSGVPGLKVLRYAFSRFYLWCMLPGVQDQMEGCPAEDVNLLYLILSALLGVLVFIIFHVCVLIKKRSSKQKSNIKLAKMQDFEFQELQVELYGEKALRRFQHLNSTHHSRSEGDTGHSEAVTGMAEA
jgi:hypothetical protein